MSMPRIQRPRWPYTVNRDNQQSEGLLALYPAAGALHSNHYLHDLFAGQHGTLQAGYNPTYGPVAIMADGGSGAYYSASAFLVPNVFLGLPVAEATIMVWCQRVDIGQARCGPPVGFHASAQELHYPFDNINYLGTFYTGRASTTDAIPYYAAHVLTFTTHPVKGWTIYQNATPRIQLAAAFTTSFLGLGTNIIGGGGFGYAVYQAFIGYIGEVRFYSRWLSPEEVAAAVDPQGRYDIYHELGRKSYSLGVAPVVTPGVDRHHHILGV